MTLRAMKLLDGVMFALVLGFVDGHRVDSSQLVISEGGELDMDEEDLDPVEAGTKERLA